MSLKERMATVRSTTRAETTSINEGLRSYMLKVYNFMSSGVLLTGIVAIILFKLSVVTNASGSITGLTSIGNAIYNTGLMWVIALAPLGVVFYMSFGIEKMSVARAQTVFWIFAALMGASLSSIFVVYTGVSIARVFFITAGTFGAMSLYGYTTKKDLTGLGSFLMMGLIGIIIASIVNIFVKSSATEFVISVLGVLIFVGLTAYDTQKIKEMYFATSRGGEAAAKTAIMGALTLYLDFINLFIMLLRLFGQRRD
jgi:FtsH-binding integral membrane protein